MGEDILNSIMIIFLIRGACNSKPIYPCSGCTMKKIRFIRLTAIKVVVVGSIIFGPSQAFASVLYAVTGDGGDPSETLFTLDQSTAAETSVLTLGNGTDGEAIGFNPTDGLIYHSSGINPGDVIFESINSTFTGTTDIDIAGTLLDNDNANALTWSSSLNAFLWGTGTASGDGKQLFSVTDSGSETLIGDLDHRTNGLAFVGSTLYSVDPRSNILRTIDTTDATTIDDTVTLTLDGQEVFGGNGLATRPEDGLLFAILRTAGDKQSNRFLATIDPETGVATSIGSGSLSTGFAGLAFTSAVPVPAAIWLFGTALVGLIGFGKRKFKVVV
jgi:hypothetical protein